MAGQPLQDSWSLFLRNKQEIPGADGWHVLLAKFLAPTPPPGCVRMKMGLQRISNVTLL